MRVSVLFVIIFLSLSCVEAADNRWKSFAMSENKNTEFYYDTESLRHLSLHILRVWEKSVYLTPIRKRAIEADRTVEYSLNYREFDCLNEKNNIRLIVHFGKDGELISFYDSRDSHWTVIAPDSHVQILFSALCPKKSYE